MFNQITKALTIYFVLVPCFLFAQKASIKTHDAQNQVDISAMLVYLANSVVTTTERIANSDSVKITTTKPEARIPRQEAAMRNITTPPKAKKTAKPLVSIMGSLENQALPCRCCFNFDADSLRQAPKLSSQPVPVLPKWSVSETKPKPTTPKPKLYTMSPLQYPKHMPDTWKNYRMWHIMHKNKNMICWGIPGYSTAKCVPFQSFIPPYYKPYWK